MPNIDASATNVHGYTQELTVHESDQTFLSTEYVDILRNADKLQAEYRKQQAHLERIYGIITGSPSPSPPLSTLTQRSCYFQTCTLISSSSKAST